MINCDIFGNVAICCAVNAADTIPHAKNMVIRYRIEFFAGYVAGADDESAWKVTFATEDEYVDWLNKTVGRSWLKSEVIPRAEDRVITFSTCSYEFNNARFVLVGRLK